VLSSLVEKSENRISIMPGGGITDGNIKLIRDQTRAKEFHVSGKKLIKGRMENFDNDLYFGAKEQLNENEFYSTDFQKVKQIKTNLIN
jgi:copper homeostasis protein